MQRPDHSDPGFTLVEVLVALVVVGLLITVTMSSALLARDRVIQATAQRQAVVVARSVIERLSTEHYRRGLFGGVVNGLSWQAGEQVIALSSQRTFALVGVGVRVQTLRGGVLVSVATERIVPLAQS